MPRSWIDTKDILLQVLMEGYQRLGFGIVPARIEAVQDGYPNVSFLRGFSQSPSDRPLLTVSRLRGSTKSAWLGNAGLAPKTTAQRVPAMPNEESFRIQIESFQDTGGMSMVDWLIETAQTVLLSAYDDLTWPWEVGGYGLYFPAWTEEEDNRREFTETSGKVTFSNALVFTSTRLISIAPHAPSPPIDGFLLDVTIANAIIPGGGPSHIGLL